MACRLVLSGTTIIVRAEPGQTAPLAGLTTPSGEMMGVPGNPPLVNKFDLSATRQSQLASMYELNKFKEQVASMFKNKFGIDMGNSRLHQKPYKAKFDLMAYPPGCAYLILLNLVVKTIVQLGST
jgi:hypothetical protein